MARPLKDVQPLLAAELEDLARNVGALRREVRALPDPSSGGETQVFVQAAQPEMAAGKPWVWWQTVGGALSQYYVFDGVL